MARNNKYTTEEVIKAIEEAKGILADAARKLGCTRRTVHNYVNRYPTVKAVYKDETEKSVDYAEGKLMDLIKAKNVSAIIFFLKTKGKHRGYVERQEIAHEGEMTQKIKIIEVRMDAK